MDALEKLLYLSGVAAEYLDYAGERQLVADSDRLRVLMALGYQPDAEQQIAEAVYELDAEPWTHWLKPFYVVAEGDEAIYIHCHPEQLSIPLFWTLTLESGAQKSGRLIPAESQETGDYYLDGVRYSARELRLGGLAAGYHSLLMHQADSSHTEEAQLIVSPQHCYERVSPDEKLWGISCQLYTLRSPHNWGIGDFGDLKQLIEKAAGSGAAFIGLNPLHILCSDTPEVVSPYSPSDRRFINPLYIELQALPEFEHSDEIQTLMQRAETMQTLERLRAVQWVDYSAISELKYRLFELVYHDFLECEVVIKSERARQFHRFIVHGGEALEQIASFEVHHNAYANSYSQDPKFYCFLQWLASQQLAACQSLTQELGMTIGLLGDLAVGSVAGGCEVEQNPQLYVADVTIGAPPDPFSSTGQNWGLPVMNPVAMRKQHYHHFIELLRANMTSVGGLRIDHVMLLMRLWWCLPEEGGEAPQASGVYVYYPLHDLMSIVRLESCRNRCVIIGEDMGVVPEEFRHEMNGSGVYGNDLLYFNQYWDGRFKAPHEMREKALLLVTNHDVPTLSDWWSGDDLQRRYDLGVIESEDALVKLCQQREKEQWHLLEWLADVDLLPASRPLGVASSVATAMDMELCEALHRGCGRSQSALMLLQLEDLQLLRLPVNIPATNLEYPNWRRKQECTLDEIFNSSAVADLLQAVNKERQS